jgi:hypothetical protein
MPTTQGVSSGVAALTRAGACWVDEPSRMRSPASTSTSCATRSSCSTSSPTTSSAQLHRSLVTTGRKRRHRRGWWWWWLHRPHRAAGQPRRIAGPPARRSGGRAFWAPSWQPSQAAAAAAAACGRPPIAPRRRCRLHRQQPQHGQCHRPRQRGRTRAEEGGGGDVAAAGTPGGGVRVEHIRAAEAADVRLRGGIRQPGLCGALHSGDRYRRCRKRAAPAC